MLNHATESTRTVAAATAARSVGVSDRLSSLSTAEDEVEEAAVEERDEHDVADAVAVFVDFWKDLAAGEEAAEEVDCFVGYFGEVGC